MAAENQLDHVPLCYVRDLVDEYVVAPDAAVFEDGRLVLPEVFDEAQYDRWLLMDTAIHQAASDRIAQASPQEPSTLEENLALVRWAQTERPGVKRFIDAIANHPGFVLWLDPEPARSGSYSLRMWEKQLAGLVKEHAQAESKALARNFNMFGRLNRGSVGYMQHEGLLTEVYDGEYPGMIIDDTSLFLDLYVDDVEGIGVANAAGLLCIASFQAMHRQQKSPSL